MLLRDRLHARLREMGDAPDYVRLAEEVLAIRNATPPMARRLVDQALVVEDRREAWIRLGERIVATAPESAGVYILRDAAARPLYVGKAINIRRRLRTHFASRRWKAIKSELSRVEDVVWREVGSELEALLLEAQWIRDLAPSVNVQRGEPSNTRRISSRYVRDVVVLLPSLDADSVELIAARTAGMTMILPDVPGRPSTGRRCGTSLDVFRRTRRICGAGVRSHGRWPPSCSHGSPSAARTRRDSK